MAVALLDTNVLFAAVSARDEYHEPAREIVGGVDHGDLPEARVTNYVVAETLNLVRGKIGPDAATDLLDRLLAGAHFEVEHVPRTDFTTAQAVFRQYPRLSFVDATIAAYMHREDVEYLYSFDGGFDGVEGVTRLETAANPYE